MCGSLINPFQPTVVRGFSKYTRITIYRVSLQLSCNSFNLSAYSLAASISCIEQGPHISKNLWSLRCKISLITCLEVCTICKVDSLTGNSDFNSWGVTNIFSEETLMLLMLSRNMI
ncbi:hypothetical protein GARC_3172 [Paraglaciecola arctica BSs20135]|uniref:Uncharacterized protein n=1 Tax=Paraglaciecola arctica BSs20135 TaxID=493475 RepID=K6Y845_9ALTE|nr:hypothetical protein GARC_3172 [Paraglaciecola arctica BSs20135]